MQLTEQQLLQESSKYLDVMIETFSDDRDELTTYAMFLSEYERSLVQSTTTSTKAPRPIEWLEDALKTIDLELTKSSVRAKICAGLQRLSGDTWDIAKAVLGTIVTLSLTGTIAFPQTPFFITLTAIMIARIGTSSLCEEKKQ